MPQELDSCVQQIIEKKKAEFKATNGKDPTPEDLKEIESSAWAICNSAQKEVKKDVEMAKMVLLADNDKQKIQRVHTGDTRPGDMYYYLDPRWAQYLYQQSLAPTQNRPSPKDEGGGGGDSWLSGNAWRNPQTGKIVYYSGFDVNNPKESWKVPDGASWTWNYIPGKDFDKIDPTVFRQHFPDWMREGKQGGGWQPVITLANGDRYYLQPSDTEHGKYDWVPAEPYETGYWAYDKGELIYYPSAINPNGKTLVNDETKPLKNPDGTDKKDKDGNIMYEPKEVDSGSPSAVHLPLLDTGLSDKEIRSAWEGGYVTIRTDPANGIAYGTINNSWYDINGKTPNRTDPADVKSTPEMRDYIQNIHHKTLPDNYAERIEKDIKDRSKKSEDKKIKEQAMEDIKNTPEGPKTPFTPSAPNTEDLSVCFSEGGTNGTSPPPGSPGSAENPININCATEMTEEERIEDINTWANQTGEGLYNFTPETSGAQTLEQGNQCPAEQYALCSWDNCMAENCATDVQFAEPMGMSNITSEVDINPMEQNNESKEIDEEVKNKIKEKLSDEFTIKDMQMNEDGTISLLIGPMEGSYVENAEVELKLAGFMAKPSGKKKFKSIAITPGKFKATDDTIINVDDNFLKLNAGIFKNKPLVLVDFNQATEKDTHKGTEVGLVLNSYYCPDYGAIVYEGELNDGVDLDLSTIEGSSVGMKMSKPAIGRHIALIPKCNEDKTCLRPQDANARLIDMAEVVYMNPKENEEIKKQLIRERKPYVSEIVAAEIKSGKIRPDLVEDRMRELYGKNKATLELMAAEMTPEVPKTNPKQNTQELEAANLSAEDRLERAMKKDPFWSGLGE